MEVKVTTYDFKGKLKEETFYAYGEKQTVESAFGIAENITFGFSHNTFKICNNDREPVITFMYENIPHILKYLKKYYNVPVAIVNCYKSIPGKYAITEIIMNDMSDKSN